MKIKILMALSAIALAIIGIALTFFPNEIAAQFSGNVALPLMVQLMGAMYFAFAMLNWMAKGAIIGGIYNRPIAIANFTHFFIGALALLKAVIRNHDLPPVFFVLAGVYIIFAIFFTRILFVHPGGKAADK